MRTYTISFFLAIYTDPHHTRLNTRGGEYHICIWAPPQLYTSSFQLLEPLQEGMREAKKQKA